MTNPKPKSCPRCGGAVVVYRYDSGWRHAECEQCDYIGPGEGSIRHAIQAHNSKVTASDVCGGEASERAVATHRERLA